MHIIIYLIALLEGFTTLSVEITALRIFSPIIGVNSISTSIILGVILLALSYGYYIGGKITARTSKVEKYLLRNLLFSSIYYFFLTFVFSGMTLELFLQVIPSYTLAILLTSIVLFFIPVFLASQTIPLLSELLKGNHSGEKIGKLLFYSTIGSFAGSVGTSVVLFPTIGVDKTAIISPLLLVICGLLLLVYLKRNNGFYIVGFSSLIILYSVILMSDIKLNSNTIYKTSNAYHTIEIYNNEYNQRIFSMDGAYSSGINIENSESFFYYIREIKKQIIESNSKNILIIGAAGFTLPNELSQIKSIENIDVIDIDKDLKEISEKYFLQKKLSDKIKFYPQSARFYLNQLNGKQYDAVVVDAYSGQSLPSQILTVEFFEKLEHISDSIYLNMISDRKLESMFAKKLFATIYKGFGNHLYYKDVNLDNHQLTNFVITNKKNDNYLKFYGNKQSIYTDNKHTIELDLFDINSKIWQ